MPLYEYACDSCETRFERIQKFSDPPVDTCPECGGPVRKLISSPAIQFKGTGWYVTDYARSGSADKGAGGETKKKADSDSSGKASEAGGAAADSAASKSAADSSSAPASTPSGTPARK